MPVSIRIPRNWKKRKYNQYHKSNSKFKPEYYLEAYTHAKQGASNRQIAKLLGVQVITFRNWRKEDPAFQAALDKGRGGKDRKEDVFIDYVERHLPARLRELWNKIFAYNKEKKIRKIECLLLRKGLRTRQRLFIHALIHCNFNMSRASRMLAMNNITPTRWIKEDPEFRDLINSIDNIRKDFWDEELYKLGKAGNPFIVWNVNRAINKDRGYGERTTVALEGSVKHSHAVVDVSSLGLPPAQLQAILGALKAKEQKALPPADGKIVDSMPASPDFTQDGDFDMAQFENVDTLAPDEVEVKDASEEVK